MAGNGPRVTKRSLNAYIDELHQKIASLQQNGERIDPSPLSPDYAEDRSPDLKHDSPQLSRSSVHDHEESHQLHQEIEDPASGLTNPLSTGPPAFMSADNGRTFYLGTSSNWSFARRVLSLTHEHIYQEALPTGALIFDGATYDLGWDGLRRSHSTAEPPAVPTYDHAMYLINVVKFRCGQLYHLFDESEFMANLQEFYSEPKPNATTGLWYVHFLLILAFGKGFVKHKVQGNRPPGADYFVKALEMLPDVIVLHEAPIESTEVMCCIALYLQALDCRSSAHNYIGQAMRMAMAEGMHTQMPIEYLGENMVQRCRKIWWTVYILDREMTSLMGLPQTLNDDQINTLLPTFPGSMQRTAAIGMHIRLSRIIAEINGSVYAIDGRINRNFLLRTKSALANIASLADELRRAFPLQMDREISGVSRISAYLHLLYHQCIVLATRPLLFCFLKIRFESPENCIEVLNTSRTVRNLIQMSMDSAQQIICILHSLQTEGLLETFLSFDLESIFVSTVVLLMGPAIDTRWTYPIWLEKAYTIFEEIIESGNLLAKFRRSELHLLDELLSCFPQEHPRCLSAPVSFPNNVLNNNSQVSLASSFPPSGQAQPTASTAQAQLEHDILSDPGVGVGVGVPALDDQELGFTSRLTAEQIMAVADSIESIDTEWMSNAMIEHSIW
ncbi:hypothetical protein N7509_013788 [Penicillium cosmopolitanum]|uniref:Xylanolytic transcriptional activator regulatory domain-containing protein n=1 Tax=Penicillium cosmopolitanum TaxID=1131564 RepID=A0A9W9VCG6_9EURO|nr:uncharacterized protein N7509_013788 [Penicillium cosmopolitanum]KAJ5376902.1 hypothetical protein N7509_013788 [Penicillium cosmopolitanum]